MTDNNNSKRDILGLKSLKPEHEIAKLQAQNLKMYLAVEGMYEASINHRLNTADPSVADVVLWEKIESFIDVK